MYGERLFSNKIQKLIPLLLHQLAAARFHIEAHDRFGI